MVMRLSELIEGLMPVAVTGDCLVEGLSCDSRNVGEGDLFFAVKGEHFDGNEFIEDALMKRAGAVVSESPPDLTVDVPYVQVQDIYTAMAGIADRFYGHPSGMLSITGITGTNGKTTTSYILHNILSADGVNAGLLGTIKYILGTRELRGRFTTPEALDFQRMLADMHDRGITHAVAEISSHALSLKRVDFTNFDVAVFTNLTRDHLDFHGDMEAYYRAKRRLFLELARHIAVVNIDDPYGRRLVKEIREGMGQVADLQVITCGINSDDAELRAVEIKEGFEGLDFTVMYGSEVFPVSSPLLGVTNVYNILSAIGASVALGLGRERIVEGVRQCRGVEGRMEPVKAGQGFLAIIDYAHTPDALQKVLETLRRLTRGRIITVFGCGGDRDRGKRPEMGRIAAELSDTAIVTSDNPRTEDPVGIVDDIVGGMKKGEYIIEPDRKKAIEEAVRISGPDDIVLIAGKGHEEYQEIREVRYPFSDREILREAIRGLTIED
ncbi:UDP-N-acetylmuramoylalanyl-D-glutamate--2,6-diaminopimelate ligase [hydrothermal vent metagenome]|uniref:UDP-N-acetylmuramoylalanyl-D-glutamate--2,6-diaminopimelate ligase n=2 Tax=hydrothermal vent metagenome TaxID=652676 RepID=A0A3B1DMC1_9ZZZZ